MISTLISEFIAHLQCTEAQGQKSSNMEPIIDYAAEQHCVLCRNKIQFYSSTCREYDEGDDLDNVENWETAVLALGCKQHYCSNVSFPLVVGYSFLSSFAYFYLLL